MRLRTEHGQKLRVFQRIEHFCEGGADFGLAAGETVGDRDLHAQALLVGLAELDALDGAGGAGEALLQGGPVGLGRGHAH